MNDVDSEDWAIVTELTDEQRSKLRRLSMTDYPAAADARAILNEIDRRSETDA